MATTSSCIIVEQKRDFDLSIVLKSFQEAVVGERVTLGNEDPVGSINDSSRDQQTDTPVQILRIEPYLKAFTELTRLTGPVFTFVARDLTAKIHIVQQHLESNSRRQQAAVGSSRQQYHLESAIQHELREGSVHNKGSSASVSRTFLRLHWALEFIIEFMDRLADAPKNSKTSKLVYEVYELTLHKHHPWWTRQLAYLAVHTLPSIGHLIDIMCKHDYDDVTRLLKSIVAIGRPILNFTTQLYLNYDLSNIV